MCKLISIFTVATIAGGAAVAGTALIGGTILMSACGLCQLGRCLRAGPRPAQSSQSTL